MDLTQIVSNRIEKLVGTLKDEDSLKEAMKRKFTKKELKVLFSTEEGISNADIAKEIHTDEKRVEELYKAAIKKLNQEKIKQELCE